MSNKTSQQTNIRYHNLSDVRGYAKWHMRQRPSKRRGFNYYVRMRAQAMGVAIKATEYISDLSDVDFSLVRKGMKRCDYLKGVNFRNCIIRRGYFYGLDLTGTDFRGCDLSGAYFRGCNLSKTDFRGANLYRANVSRSNFIEALTEGANLKGIHYGGDMDREEELLERSNNDK